MEKTNKGAISEQKLKVVYLPAEDGSTNNQGIPEEEEVGEASRVEEPVSSCVFPRGNGFDRDLPLHFLFRNFQLRISSSCFKFFLSDSHGKKNNIYHEGLKRWTTKRVKEYDPALFRNGGLTYWEIEQPPYKPPAAVCLFFSAFPLFFFVHDCIIS